MLWKTSCFIPTLGTRSQWDPAPWLLLHEGPQTRGLQALGQLCQQAAELPGEQPAGQQEGPSISCFPSLSVLIYYSFYCVRPRASVRNIHTAQIQINVRSCVETSHKCTHKSKQLILSIFKKPAIFQPDSRFFFVFWWEAELFGKKTVILSSIGQPIAMLWNTHGETSLLWQCRKFGCLKCPDSSCN